MNILDGKIIKKQILDEFKDKVNMLNVKPNFVVIQVGNNEASNIYIRNKNKMAEYIGYNFNLVKFNENISEELLLNEINKLNNDNNVHGILVQMPLPSHINTDKVQNAVSSLKDIDGLSDLNAGILFHKKNTLFPCTPLGVMELLKRYNISVSGLNAVVVGRSNLVGKPMAMMLTNADATVTLCHSKTKNLGEITKRADLLVVAVGHPKLITEDMVKDGAIVIDVGINKTDNGLCGDVDFDNVINKASYITPVPGGVGQMTVAMLANNILEAYKMQK